MRLFAFFSAPRAGARARKKNRKSETIAVILAMALVGMGLGGLAPLLSLELEAMGMPGRFIGFNAAMVEVAALATAPFAPRLLVRFRPVAVLAAALCLSSLCVAAFWIFHDPWLWIVLRFINGAALTIIFTSGEYWITALAGERHRGKVIGFYATVLAAGFAAGPVTLHATGVHGPTPYVTFAMLVALAFVPLGLARSRGPRQRLRPREGFTSALFAVPAATVAAFACGALETQAIGLLPVYGVRAAMSPQAAALLVTAFLAGNAVFQIPAGALADRFGSRVILFVCACAGIATVLAMPSALAAPRMLYGLVFVGGGIAGAFYTVGLALLAGHLRGRGLAAATASFAFLYGAGGALATVAGGIALDVSAVYGLPVTMALILAAAAMAAVFGRPRARRTLAPRRDAGYP